MLVYCNDCGYVFHNHELFYDITIGEACPRCDSTNHEEAVRCCECHEVVPISQAFCKEQGCEDWDPVYICNACLDKLAGE